MNAIKIRCGIGLRKVQRKRNTIRDEFVCFFLISPFPHFPHEHDEGEKRFHFILLLYKFEFNINFLLILISFNHQSCDYEYVRCLTNAKYTDTNKCVRESINESFSQSMLFIIRLLFL